MILFHLNVKYSHKQMNEQNISELVLFLNRFQIFTLSSKDKSIFSTAAFSTIATTLIPHQFTSMQMSTCTNGVALKLIPSCEWELWQLLLSDRFYRDNINNNNKNTAVETQKQLVTRQTSKPAYCNLNLLKPVQSEEKVQDLLSFQLNTEC